MRIFLALALVLAPSTASFAENSLVLSVQQTAEQDQRQFKLNYDYGMEDFHISPYISASMAEIQGKKHDATEMSYAYGLGFLYDIFTYESNRLSLGIKYSAVNFPSSSNEAFDAGLRYDAALSHSVVAQIELEYRYAEWRELSGFQSSFGLGYRW